MSRQELQLNVTADASGFKAGVGTAANVTREFQKTLMEADGKLKILGQNARVRAEETKRAMSGIKDAMKEAMGDSLGSVAKFGVAGGAAAVVIGTLKDLALGYMEAKRKAADFADNIEAAAERTGFSVQNFQKLNGAALMTNTTMEDVEKGMKKLQTTLGSDMTKQQAEAFERLGLNVETLKGLNPDDLFDRVAGAVGKVEDPTKRAAAAVELFGKAGTKLIPMAENLEALKDQAVQLGLVMSDENIKKLASFENRQKIEQQKAIVSMSKGEQSEFVLDKEAKFLAYKNMGYSDKAASVKVAQAVKDESRKKRVADDLQDSRVKGLAAMSPAEVKEYFELAKYEAAAKKEKLAEETDAAQRAASIANYEKERESAEKEQAQSAKSKAEASRKAAERLSELAASDDDSFEAKAAREAMVGFRGSNEDYVKKVGEIKRQMEDWYKATQEAAAIEEKMVEVQKKAKEQARERIKKAQEAVATAETESATAAQEKAAKKAQAELKTAQDTFEAQADALGFGRMGLVNPNSPAMRQAIAEGKTTALNEQVKAEMNLANMGQDQRSGVLAAQRRQAREMALSDARIQRVMRGGGGQLTAFDKQRIAEVEKARRDAAKRMVDAAKAAKEAEAAQERKHKEHMKHLVEVRDAALKAGALVQ